VVTAVPLPTAREEIVAMKTAAESTASLVPPSATNPAAETTALPASFIAPSIFPGSQSSGAGTSSFGLPTSVAAVEGCAPMCGAGGRLFSFNAASSQAVVMPVGSVATSAATPLPPTQPAVSVASNSSATVGPFVSQQPVISSASLSSNQPPAVPFSGVAPPASSQAVSGGSLGFPFKPSTAVASAGSDSHGFGNDGNASFPFGSLPTQPSLGSSASTTGSSLSSAPGFAPSFAAFGKSQQSFQPVFGNPGSQNTVPGFGSFNSTDKKSTVPVSASAQTVVPSSISGTFQTSANHSVSSTFGSFAAASTNPAPFGSSTLPSGVFAQSLSKSHGQTVSNAFGGLNGTSASGTVARSASFVFAQPAPVSQSSFGAVSSGSVPAFASSNLQPGSNNVFGSSNSVPSQQPVANAFGSGFTSVSSATTSSRSFAFAQPASVVGQSSVSNPSFGGVAAAAFSSSVVQTASSAFAAGSGPVFNGMPVAATPAPQPSLPNGFHKPAAGAADPFDFSGKNNPAASGTSGAFVFGQSAPSGVNGFAASAVPAFGASSPATPFAFGKPSLHAYAAVIGKASPCSITERRVSELIPVLGSQPAGDVSHKPGREWWGTGMVICLERDADLHMAQLMPLSLAPVKSRLVVPFWYRLTQVVLEKRPLNGCSSVVVVTVYTFPCEDCCCMNLLQFSQLLHVKI